MDAFISQALLVVNYMVPSLGMHPVKRQNVSPKGTAIDWAEWSPLATVCPTRAARYGRPRSVCRARGGQGKRTGKAMTRKSLAAERLANLVANLREIERAKLAAQGSTFSEFPGEKLAERISLALRAAERAGRLDGRNPERTEADHRFAGSGTLFERIESDWIALMLDHGRPDLIVPLSPEPAPVTEGATG